MDQPYEVCISGELVLPSGAVSAWRALPIDPTLYSDWPEAFTALVEQEPVSIGAWLDDLKYERGGRRTYLDIQVEGGRVRFEGLLAEEEFERWRRQIVTMFRLADRVDASGELLVVSPEIELGHHVRVGDKTSHVRTLDAREVAAAREDERIKRILRPAAA